MSIYVLIPLPTLRGGGKQVGHLKPYLFHRPATDPAGRTTARLSDGDGMTYKYNDICWIFHMEYCDFLYQVEVVRDPLSEVSYP